MIGEVASGDDWAVEHTGEGCHVFVVDGLGHGVQAADAAKQAIIGFEETRRHSPIERMEAIHARLRSTRGAAAAMATIDRHARQVSLVGVGNIAGVVSDGVESRSMVSMSGTLGHNVRVLRSFSYPWGPNSTLVMHSDGVSGRWDWANYPGLRQHVPVLAAAVLYRDMARGKDDATVVVARENGAKA